MVDDKGEDGSVPAEDAGASGRAAGFQGPLRDIVAVIRGRAEQPLVLLESVVADLQRARTPAAMRLERLETAVGTCRSMERTMRGWGLTEVADLVHALRLRLQRFETRPDEDPATAAHLSEALRAELDAVVDLVPKEEGRDKKKKQARPRLLVTLGDSPESISIGLAATSAGYEVFLDPHPLQAIRRQAAWDAVLMDPSLPEGLDQGLEALARLHEERPGTPVVVYTDHDDATDRRAYVHHGARAFLERPMPRRTVVDTLEEVRQGVERPGRVVILHGDEEEGRDWTSTLVQAGLVVHALADAKDLWNALDVVRPELLLVSGGHDHLAGIVRTIRLDPMQDGLSILAIDESGDADQHHRLYDAGVDGVMMRPVRPSLVVSRVTNQITRSRCLRRRALVDPVTGLHEPGETRIRLRQAVRGAREAEAALTIVVFAPDEKEGRRPSQRHAALRRLGNGVRGLCRPHDIIGIVEQGRVVAAFAGLPPEEILSRVDALLRTLKGQPGGSVAPDAAEPCSAGAAVLPDDGDQTMSLIEHAIERLHAAQAAGGGRLEAPRQFGQVESAATGPDILLIDDDPSLAELLGYAFRVRDLDMQWIDDGKDALDSLLAADGVHPRLVLLSVDLPGIDGLTILRRLNERRRTRNMPVIVLSARSSEGEVLEAMRLGAVDHVAKPFRYQILFERVRNALEAGDGP